MLHKLVYFYRRYFYSNFALSIKSSLLNKKKILVLQTSAVKYTENLNVFEKSAYQSHTKRDSNRFEILHCLWEKCEIITEFLQRWRQLNLLIVYIIAFS